MDEGAETSTERCCPIAKLTSCRSVYSAVPKRGLWHDSNSIGPADRADSHRDPFRVLPSSLLHPEILHAITEHMVSTTGDNGENMDNDYEQDEICHLRSFDSYQEMKYKFRSLRSLVCDLLKTNQELRNALLEAKNDGPQSRNSPR